jgi:hypothetical protein
MSTAPMLSPNCNAAALYQDGRTIFPVFIISFVICTPIRNLSVNYQRRASIQKLDFPIFAIFKMQEINFCNMIPLAENLGPGTDVMNLKIFSPPKNGGKNWHFLFRIQLVFFAKFES